MIHLWLESWLLVDLLPLLRILLWSLPQQRSDNWSEKALRRRTQGTGRMRYLKTVTRKLKNGFHVGSAPARKRVAPPPA